MPLTNAPRQIEAPKAPSFSGERRMRENGVRSAADYESGGRRELAMQRSPERRPSRKLILAYFEGNRTLLLYLYAEIFKGARITPPLSQRRTAPVLITVP